MAVRGGHDEIVERRDRIGQRAARDDTILTNEGLGDDDERGTGR